VYGDGVVQPVQFSAAHGRYRGGKRATGPPLLPVAALQLALAALTSCGDVRPDGATGDQADTGTVAVPGDFDGDGFAAADDCDDENPYGWLTPDVYAGDLEGEELSEFCEGYCERSLSGDLDLSGAGRAWVAALSCLTSVGGDLTLRDNEELTRLEGLEAPSTSTVRWGACRASRPSVRLAGTSSSSTTGR
jgi:hypothetical protein